MALVIVNAEKYNGNMKAVVSKNGKINLTVKTAKSLNVTKGVLLGYDDKNPKKLYFIVPKTPTAKRNFEAKKNGNYITINSSRFLDDHGVNYKDAHVSFLFHRKSELDNEGNGDVYEIESMAESNASAKRHYTRKKAQQ